MKKLLQTIILTSISFSFVGCAVVEKQPIIINQAPRYQPVRRAAPVYAPVPEFQTVSFVCY